MRIAVHWSDKKQPTYYSAPKTLSRAKSLALDIYAKFCRDGERVTIEKDGLTIWTHG